MKMKSFISKWNQIAGCNKFILNIRRFGGVPIVIVSLRTTTVHSSSKNLTCSEKMWKPRKRFNSDPFGR